MTQGGRHSEWPVLFDIAVRILAHCRNAIHFAPKWSFGGGTALMLQIGHRESRDIDLFLDDAQVLPFLNPVTQDMEPACHPDSYAGDGARTLKLSYGDVGEIDFICCAAIVDIPTSVETVNGHSVALETPAEIIAKKVYYRGGSFQPRDMFDLAAVAETCGTAYAVAALRQCGSARCEAALRVAETADPAFVKTINGQLIVDDTMRHLIESAQEVSRNLLASLS